jgi:hypothetical protein
VNEDLDEGSEEARAQRDAEVQNLIDRIANNESLAMTAEVDEMVVTLRSKVGVGIWDTGCRKTVCKSQLASQICAGLGELGLPRGVCHLR